MVLISSQLVLSSPLCLTSHNVQVIDFELSLFACSYLRHHSAMCTSSYIPDCSHLFYSSDCSTMDKETGSYCIVVRAESSQNSFLELEKVRDKVLPTLLEMVVKGFQEIKSIDILWSDRFRELYLRVSMTRVCKRRLWGTLMDHCLKIMDLIDWSRSHPDNMNEFCSVYGVDAGWKYFLNNLESAVSDIGKSILPEHLLLVANSLSATGYFVGLTPKGLAQQRGNASVASPFTQACFSTPAACIIKAAKAEVTDGLKGSLDALAWGKTPPFGTGGQFELIYSGKGHEIDKPADVYDLLVADVSNKQNVMEKPNAVNHTSVKSVKFGAQLLYKYGNSASKGLKKLGISKASITISKLFTVNDIWKLESQLQSILKKYEIDERLNDLDKSTLMFALHFHPERDLKIGVGAQDIKVAYHKEHENSRCFMLVRVDGTVEDFSYRKCIRGALEIIDPPRAKTYRTKKQNGSD